MKNTDVSTIEHNFFNKLSSIKNNMNQAKADKVETIKEFMTPICEVIQSLYDIWNEEKNSIEQQLKTIAQNHNFKFRVHHELSEFSLMRNIEERFPLLNDGGDYTDIDIDYLDHAWEFKSKSNSEMLIIEINPIDSRARYPVDPDDNPAAFTYTLPIKLHQKFIDGAEDRHESLKEYFHITVKDELNKIETRIKEYLNIAEVNIAGIDFTDPQVRAALEKKLKQH
jgi:hypothetical protein